MTIPVAGEGRKLCWETRCFPVETPRASILEDDGHVEVSQNMLKSFTAQHKDTAERRLKVNVKVSKAS